MKYCSQCGTKVFLSMPEGDDRKRWMCPACPMVHYQNPNIVMGCIPEYNEQVLLCRRAIEPRSGYWTLPAGFMELGETTWEGAIRETWEEARARVDIKSLYVVFNIPHANQVFMIFRAALPIPEFEPGLESLEVALFNEASIPWEDIAFSTVHHTLKHFFADQRRRHFILHTGDIIKTSKGDCLREIPMDNAPKNSLQT
ncbi:MAG: NUDIX hydrolase [Candidatus Eutrophobiaceae bacterium]